QRGRQRLAGGGGGRGHGPLPGHRLPLGRVGPGRRRSPPGGPPGGATGPLESARHLGGGPLIRCLLDPAPSLRGRPDGGAPAAHRRPNKARWRGRCSGAPPGAGRGRAWWWVVGESEPPGAHHAREGKKRWGRAPGPPLAVWQAVAAWGDAPRPRGFTGREEASRQGGPGPWPPPKGGDGPPPPGRSVSFRVWLEWDHQNPTGSVR